MVGVTEETSTMDTLAIQDSFQPYYDGCRGRRRRAVGKRPGVGAVTQSNDNAPTADDSAAGTADAPSTPKEH